MEEKAVLAESKSAEAVHTAAIAEEAKQNAHTAQMATIVQTELEAFFKRGFDGERFIPLKSGMAADRERFQFICDKVAAIDGKMVTKTDFLLLKQQSDLTSKIVIGACVLILSAVVLALVGLVIIK